MHIRDGIPLREIARQTGLSRNTIRTWLRQPEMTHPNTPPARAKASSTVGRSTAAMAADRQPPQQRERRTGRVMFETLREQGYPGSYSRVSAFIRKWQEERSENPKRSAYVPLTFALGEAFQFDWSCEYAFIGGLRRRLEVAHIKLCASRAFWVVAYPSQSHEMLFDAHARAFAAFGGIPRRGIYDNMKTAVDKVGHGKERTINARFHAMCGHYLFDPSSATGRPAGRKALSRRTSRTGAGRSGSRPPNAAGPISTASTTGSANSAGPPGPIPRTPNGRHSPLANCSKMSNSR